MISDVTFVVFHYPMADLLWVSCGYAWPTHIHQSTCEYNFLTHGATFCPISDCHSGSLAFILIHNFWISRVTIGCGLFRFDTLPYYLLKVRLLQPLTGALPWNWIPAFRLQIPRRDSWSFHSGIGSSYADQQRAVNRSVRYRIHYASWNKETSF